MRGRRVGDRAEFSRITPAQNDARRPATGSVDPGRSTPQRNASVSSSRPRRSSRLWSRDRVNVIVGRARRATRGVSSLRVRRPCDASQAACSAPPTRWRRPAIPGEGRRGFSRQVAKVNRRGCGGLGSGDDRRDELVDRSDHIGMTPFGDRDDSEWGEPPENGIPPVVGIRWAQVETTTGTPTAAPSEDRAARRRTPRRDPTVACRSSSVRRVVAEMCELLAQDPAEELARLVVGQFLDGDELSGDPARTQP